MADLPVLYLAEEYDVISHVLWNHCRSRHYPQIAVVDRTDPGIEERVSGAVLEDLEKRQRIPGNAEEDFILKNVYEPRRLDRACSALIGVAFVYPEVMAALDRAGRRAQGRGSTHHYMTAWQQEYRARFPEAGPLLRVSRVGFDQSCGQAIMEVATSVYGHRYELSRSCSGWAVTSDRMTWMS